MYMEELFTILLLVFTVYMIYEYGNYKRIKKGPPCKVIYKIKE